MESRKLLVGINGSMLDEQPTGVGTYSFNLINELSAIETSLNKCTLKVFTPTNISLDKDISVVKLSRFLQSSKHGKLAAFLRFCWNTFYYPFQAARFDLLISPTTHGSFLLNNQIITIHDLLSLQYSNINAHQRIYFRFILPLLLRKAKLIIAVSENTKKDIIKHFNYPSEKIKVIHNGFDDSIFTPGLYKSKDILDAYGVTNYFLAVGPTYPHKNFRILIESWNALPKVLKEAHPLVIAGGKPQYVAKLKKVVSDLSLDHCVHFIGYVPIKLMPSLYREALALVFPSLYEGFGIPILEAMGSGCPVMSSNTSSMPEVGGDAVLYFDPKDKNAITLAMERLIVDPEFRAGLSAKGLKQAKHFSWRKMAESFSAEIHNYSNPN